jgi:hypothetical protein
MLVSRARPSRAGRPTAVRTLDVVVEDDIQRTAVIDGTGSVGGSLDTSQALPEGVGSCRQFAGVLKGGPERCGGLEVVLVGAVSAGTRVTLWVVVPMRRPAAPTRLPVDAGAAEEPARVAVPTVEETAEVTPPTVTGADGVAGSCGARGVLGADGTLLGADGTVGTGGTRTGALAGGVGGAGALTVGAGGLAGGVTAGGGGTGGAFAAGAVGAGGAATGGGTGGTDDLAGGTAGADGVDGGVAGTAGGVTTGGGGTEGRPASALPEATIAATIDVVETISTRRCAAVRTSSHSLPA